MSKAAVRAAEKRVVATRHIDRLYKAVANYIERAGGRVVVIGGIQIQQWPGDGEFRFTVGVQCTGRKPEFALQRAKEKAR